MNLIVEYGISFSWNKNTKEATIKIGDYSITPPIETDGPWPNMSLKE